MKLVGVVSTAVLALILGIAVPAYAQEQRGDQDEAKPKQEDKAQPEKAKQEDKDAQQQEKSDKQTVKNTQQEKNTKVEKNEQVKSGQPARIPDDRYKANFGREHTFRVSQAEYGNRRFQYGGYWFGFAGVWPSNWLYTQDVFVVDIGGVYYLCNPTYPGVNVALSFSL